MLLSLSCSLSVTYNVATPTDSGESPFFVSRSRREHRLRACILCRSGQHMMRTT